MSDWICTDPDDLQWQRNIGDGLYEMIGIVAVIWGEMNDLDHDCFYLTHWIADWRDYEEYLPELLRTYGYMEHDDESDGWAVLNEVAEEDPLGFLIEMAFETYGIEDHNKVFNSFEDAEKYVNHIVGR